MFERFNGYDKSPHINQRIGDSLKLSNELKESKTGRFGIGFNSVYHLTDLPSFVTRDKLVLFDPQGVYVPNPNANNPGKIIDFVQHPQVVEQFPDQFEPYRCFGCDFTESYDGTLFRLPLRTKTQAQSSKLSSHYRSMESMEEMMHEFMEKAETLLLFLRNVHTMAWYTWEPDALEPRCIFIANVDQLNDQLLDQRHFNISRSKYSLQGEACDYRMTLRTQQTGFEALTRDWIVCNQLGGQECSKIAHSADLRKLIPYGGVALCLSHSIRGRAFCFLPLAVETTLPVHINGFFELSSNRRDIWYGDELVGDGLLRAQWNESLLIDVVAPSYARALVLASSSLPIEEYYGLFPLYSTSKRWYSLIDAIYERLRDVPCLRTGVNQWVNPRHAICICSESQEEQLRPILLEESISYVELPARLFEIIRNALSPEVLRGHFKSVEVATRNHAHIIQLLEYCTSDLTDDYSDLVGVQLVPLESSEIGTFGGRDTYYLSSLTECELLYAVSDRLINQNQLSGKLHHLLTSEIFQTALNIIPMDVNVLNTLLPNVLPPKYRNIKEIDGSGIPASWIETFWHYMIACNEFELFSENYPVLPTTEGKLCQINVPSNVVLPFLPELVASCACKIGIKILQSGIIDAGEATSSNLSNFVHPATPYGLLRAIQNTPSTTFDTTTADERNAFREYLLQDDLQGFCQADMTLLSNLPIFHGVIGYGMTQSFTTLSEIRFATSVAVPVEFLGPGFVIVSEERQLRVLERLEVEILSEATFYREHLVDPHRPNDLFEKCVIHILQNYSRLKDLESLLQDTAIVPADDDSEKYFSVHELYDPSVQELSRFLPPCHFPAKRFQEHQVLQTLRQLGLRHELSRDAILKLIDLIETVADETTITCGKELVHYIDRHANRLFHQRAFLFIKVQNDEIDQFCHDLQLKKWIPVGNKYYQPRSTRPVKDEIYCSSSYGILADDITSAELIQIFGWNDPIPVDVVVHQMLDMIQHHRDNRMYLNSILPQLYLYFTTAMDWTEDLTLKLYDHEWIWVGNNFVKPSQMAVECPIVTSPYLYTLPPYLLSSKAWFQRIFSIPDHFHMEALIDLLKQLQDDVDQICSEKQLAMAIGVAQIISGYATIEEASIYIPTAKRELVLASCTVYDDAPWIDHKPLVELPFVHPNLSNNVAARLGSKSYRTELLQVSTTAIPLTESFGQSEELTSRLRHILEQYPEGPGMLYELIQNADDAGATTVSILFNMKQYNTDSVLSEAMGDWQGPAIYCYNDAVFSNQDFEALSRIGESSKLNQSSKTGRFGLGFNSVYHYTDLPSILSGSSLVFFDPDTTNLPNATRLEPGLKMNQFSKLVKQFPDQFEPYKVLGYDDLSQPLKGSIFRFPLRNSVTASRSKIKQEFYSAEKLKKLMLIYRETLSNVLLFLRSVGSIKVFYQDGDDAVELFGVSRTTNELTSTKTTIDIVNTDCQVHSKQWVTESEVVTRTSYLVCTGIGIQESSVSVACQLNSVAKHGQVFCFLPLPLTDFTIAPVFINGYFELSSNRRNIWSGNDMSGEGNRKSQWNQDLLQNAIAPTYLYLIQSVLDYFTAQSNEYYSLFPSTMPSHPWNVLVEEFYHLAAQQKLFLEYSNSDQQLVALCDSVLLSIPQLLAQQCPLESIREICEIFRSYCCISVLQLPSHVHDMVLQQNLSLGLVDPSFICCLLRSKQLNLKLLTEKEVEVTLLFVIRQANIDIAQLDGLEIIPIDQSDEYGKYSTCTNATTCYYYCSESECALLEMSDDVNIIDPKCTVLRSLINIKESNIKLMSTESLCDSINYPHQADMVDWDLSTPPSRAWISKFWVYVQSSSVSHVKKYPLLPCKQCGRQYLLCLGSTDRVIGISAAKPDLDAILEDLGVFIVDETLVNYPEWLISSDSCHVLDNSGIERLLIQLLNEKSLKLLSKTQRQAIREFLTLNCEDVGLIENLPIFEFSNYGCEKIWKGLKQQPLYIAPEALPEKYASILGPEFVYPRSQTEREWLMNNYGVCALSQQRIFLQFLMLNLSKVQISDAIDVLSHLLDTYDVSLLSHLQGVPIIVSRENKLVRVDELYDPSLQMFTTQIPLEIFCQVEKRLNTLRHLGLQMQLSPDEVVQCALSIESEQSVDRANGLLEYLSQNEMQEFSEQLRSIRWLPILTTSPVSKLPWLTSKNPLASANESRLKDDMLFCSSSRFILAIAITSSGLRRSLGLDQPLSVSMVAHQLIETKDINRLKELYIKLDEAVARDGCEELSKTPWIWIPVREEFITSDYLSYDDGAEPLLYSYDPKTSIIPQRLIETVGIKPKFNVIDFVTALERLPRDVPLSVAEVVLVGDIVERLIGFEDHPGSVLLPDTDGFLRSSCTMLVDDMEWDDSAELRTDTVLVHPSLSHLELKAFGVHSLHEKWDQKTSYSMHLGVSRVNSIDPTDVLYDLIQVADACQCSKLSIRCDTETHQAVSVIHPSYAQYQLQPALCLYLDQYNIQASRLHELLTQSKLSSLFSLTECLQILTSEAFYIVQLSDLSFKRYHLLVRDQYPDQFSGFPSSSEINGTFLRLPIQKNIEELWEQWLEVETSSLVQSLDLHQIQYFKNEVLVQLVQLENALDVLSTRKSFQTDKKSFMSFFTTTRAQKNTQTFCIQLIRDSTTIVCKWLTAEVFVNESVVAVSCLVSQNGAITRDPPVGRVFGRLNRPSKLPVHLYSSDVHKYTEELAEAYKDLLIAASIECERMNSKGFYVFWPSVRDLSDVNEYLSSVLYNKLTKEALYLCTDGNLRYLHKGLICSDEISLEIKTFGQFHLPFFNIPESVLEDAIKMNDSKRAPIQSLTPEWMRSYLCTTRVSLSRSLCVELFEYCFTGKCAQMNQLPLLLLENGEIRRIQPSNRFILATKEQQYLLPHLMDLYVSLELVERVPELKMNTYLQREMGVKLFSNSFLEQHLAEVLPSSWINVKIVEDTTPIEPLWLYRFWKQVGLSDSECERFKKWPLLPVKSKALYSCSLRNQVVCVWDYSIDQPLAQSLSLQDNSETCEEDRDILNPDRFDLMASIHEILLELRLPILELAYFPTYRVPMERVANDLLDRLVDLPLENLSDSYKECLGSFFSYFGRQYGTLTAADCKRLRQLPIYCTLENKYISLSDRQYYMVDPTSDIPAGILTNTIPLSMILKHQEEMQWLIEQLDGVKQLNESDLLLEYFAPGAESIESEKLLQMIVDKWPILKQNTAFVDLLKQKAFNLQPEASPRPANQYLDPENPVLFELFRDTPSSFPAESYRTVKWLTFLRDIGMKTEIDDCDIFLTCAKHVAASGDVTKANLLVNYYEDMVELGFDFSKIKCIPAYNSSNRVMLYALQDCALHRDRHLCFNVCGILQSSTICLDPQIESPPSLDKIIQHIAECDVLDDWNYEDPVVDVFQSIFTYFQSNWDSFDPTSRAKLCAIERLIPIGSALRSPKHVFLKLDTYSFAPFLFPNPNPFAAFSDLFSQLGAKDFPDGCDFQAILQQEDRKLTINELEAVLKIIESTNEIICLPNAYSVLKPFASLIYNDAPWYHTRIDFAKVPLVHPKVPTQVAIQAGLSSLTSVLTQKYQVSGPILSNWTDEMMKLIQSDPFKAQIRDLILISDGNDHVVDYLDQYEIKLVESIDVCDYFVNEIKVNSRTRVSHVINRETRVIYLTHEKTHLVRNLTSALRDLMERQWSDEYLVEDLLNTTGSYRMSCFQRRKLGSRVMLNDQTQLILKPFRSFLPGEYVAVFENNKASFRYGKIKSQVTSTQWNVQLNSTEERVVESNCLYAFESSTRSSSIPVTSSILCRLKASTDESSPPESLLSALSSILKRFNYRLDMGFEQALVENQSLQQTYENQTNECRLLQKELEKAQEKIEAFEERRLCPICTEIQVNRVLDPCGHTFCHTCCQRFQTCPLCRVDLNKAHRLHLP